MVRDEDWAMSVPGEEMSVSLVGVLGEGSLLSAGSVVWLALCEVVVVVVKRGTLEREGNVS